MECKDEYMARLFAPQASVKEVVVERAAPVEVVVEQVVPEKRRIITKARKVRPRNEQLEDAKVTIRALPLLNRAGCRREHSVRVRPDQTNRTNDYYQDHSQHHGVFRDVLAFVVCPEFRNKIGHGSPSV